MPVLFYFRLNLYNEKYFKNRKVVLMDFTSQKKKQESMREKKNYLFYKELFILKKKKEKKERFALVAKKFSNTHTHTLSLENSLFSTPPSHTHTNDNWNLTFLKAISL